MKTSSRGCGVVLVGIDVNLPPGLRIAQSETSFTIEGTSQQSGTFYYDTVVYFNHQMVGTRRTPIHIK